MCFVTTWADKHRLACAFVVKRHCRKALGAGQIGSLGVLLGLRHDVELLAFAVDLTLVVVLGGALVRGPELKQRWPHLFSLIILFT